MEKCSYFIKERALFGSFPTQKDVEFFENMGVRYFLDLTTGQERGTRTYNTRYVHTRYTIQDGNIPDDPPGFWKLIRHICHVIGTLGEGEKIYVHCRGGHGRSGVVVACILCHYYRIPPQKALHLTKKYHNRRGHMREINKVIGSPRTIRQKRFVIDNFMPLYLGQHLTGIGYRLSNGFICQVKTDLGVFRIVEAAYQAYKDPENREYVQAQMNAMTIAESKAVALTCNVRSDWESVKLEFMAEVLCCKFQQNERLLTELRRTGLRPIIEVGDSYWGDGSVDGGVGQNVLGKLLVSLRETL